MVGGLVLKASLLQKFYIRGAYWLLEVNEDWISPDLEKHINYLLPKLIALMCKNKRPMEEIKKVLDIYAYYFYLVRAGILNTPVFVSNIAEGGITTRPIRNTNISKGG